MENLTFEFQPISIGMGIIPGLFHPVLSFAQKIDHLAIVFHFGLEILREIVSFKG